MLVAATITNRANCLRFIFWSRLLYFLLYVSLGWYLCIKWFTWFSPEPIYLTESCSIMIFIYTTNPSKIKKILTIIRLEELKISTTKVNSDSPNFTPNGKFTSSLFWMISKSKFSRFSEFSSSEICLFRSKLAVFICALVWVMFLSSRNLIFWIGR